MLPLHQAEELRASLTAYFRAAYAFRDRAVGEALHDFIADPERGMFKGPYLSVKLPFATAVSNEEVPLEIKDRFTPYDHQLRAFQRLTSRGGHTPQATIMTTGTGSGKTESFLYPLLDYCYAQRERPGIKAIILYPMNALATDQAARFAKAVKENPNLKGAGLRIGLLIGAGKQDKGKERPTTMGRDHVIEDRDTILKSPPDILLTNFKMLDYALMRARYQQLWTLNLQDRELLRFLVLDELHTYDGAQGSDVANLIRRLKLKFGYGRGQLCPVGTSATVGDGAEGKEQLSSYAGRVFGEDFGEGAIIGEKRLGADEFFNTANRHLLPDFAVADQLTFQPDDSFDAYVKRQQLVWGLPADANGAEVGEWLRGSLLFEEIIASCGPAPKLLTEVSREVGRKHERFARLEPELQEALIISLLSLAGKASNIYGGSLLSIQVQLWIRELSGVVRALTDAPAFDWRLPGETSTDGSALALPLWHCRECGGSGWIGRKPDNRPNFISDHGKIFEAYFGKDKNTWFLNTDTEDHQPIGEYNATDTSRGYLDPLSLLFTNKKAEGLIPIVATRKYDGHKGDRSCPLCNDRSNSVSIVGGRATTIASVVTGQVLATELDNTPERDRKVLLFTNSVQDAAHQAGFVQARNYRFTFRTALQTVISAQSGPVTLDRLIEKFKDIWYGQLRAIYPDNPWEAYVNQFFPAKKVGRVDPAHYRHKGIYDAKFMRELDLAISWETVAEFGYNATVGRTLERTLTCAVTLDPRPLTGLHAKLHPWLQENMMGQISPDQLRAYVTGLLLRQRQRGAVGHPFLAKFRTEGASLWNLNYKRDDRHYLNPGFGPNSRFPRPLQAEPLHKKDSPLDTTCASKDNWHTAYFRRSFPLVADSLPAINEFHARLLPALAELGLLEACRGPEGINYCIKPEVLQLGADAGAVECPKCNVRQTRPAGDDTLVGLPCITYRCTGEYRVVADGTNYYQSVYNRNRAPRIYATDHTGLLDRGDRERKEIDFRERPHTNSLNALVATSTLEMGIDIGDLNVTMNTAVPPLPSNFLQRVGRAGRKSGSALIVNLAKSSQSHDLFYYEEPGEMMAGKVHTPGCFLSAREILKRHFLAYVIDSWTALDPDRNEVPARLGEIGLTPDKLEDPSWVPNRIAAYLDEAGEERLATFKTGYQHDGIDPETLTALEDYVRHGFLRGRLLGCFRKLVDNRQEVVKHRAYIREELDSGKYGKTDDTYKNYERQMKALGATLNKLRKRQSLEHLTNFGLLPNYAFPETGVTMTAEIITPRRQDDGTTVYDPTTIEAVRPARSALREMVPGSMFYTQGWQLPVTGINTVDYGETTAYYRFCSNCDHLQLDPDGTTVAFCPKCNDHSFSTPDNRHLLSTLREVKASASRDDATIRDNKEERDRGRQLISRHFDFGDSESQGAFALTDIPFGVEYVKQVTLREVNAGHQQHRESGRSVTIDQGEVNAAGYITCRYCGKSTTHTRKETNYNEQKEAADYHYAYCRQKEHAYRGQTDEVMKELFLLREMNSEVLRVLLPIQEFEREAHLQMFIAGINLGLRHFYGGNPQHIGIYSYSEYNQRSKRFDVYLVLLDVIPGGTGYLGKLFTTANVTRLLELAYTQISNCSCQDRGRDGCYHCIYSYSTQHFHHELSRRATEALFRKILDKCRDWVDLPNGLETVAGTSQIEESELELRFVRLFRTHSSREGSGWSIEEHNRDGHIEYRLTYQRDETVYRYVLSPQVALGQREGIEKPTRADFLLRLEGGKQAGQELTREDIRARTRVPIFMDGWHYHASRNHPRFATDVGKRCAILQSGAYVSWTLTFEDVISAERALGLDDKRNEGRGSDELANAHAIKAHHTVAGQLVKFPGKGDGRDFSALDGNFERLRWWLEQGLDREAMQQKCHASLSALQQSLNTENYTSDQVAAVLGGKALLAAFDPMVKSSGLSHAHLNGFPAFASADFSATAFVMLGAAKLYFKLTVDPKDGEGYGKESWYYFWRLFNLLQLATDQPLTQRQIGEEAAASFSVAVVPAETVIPARTTDVITGPTLKALEYYDQVYHPLIQSIVEATALSEEELEGSFFLMEGDDPDGLLLAEAVIGSKEKRVVSGPLTHRDREIFVAHGYTIYAPTDLQLHHL